MVRVAPGSMRSQRKSGWVSPSTQGSASGGQPRPCWKSAKLPAARTRSGWSKGVEPSHTGCSVLRARRTAGGGSASGSRPCGLCSGWSTARAKSARNVEPGEGSAASLRSSSSTSKPPENARRAREGSSETGPTGPSTSTSAPGSGAVESGIAIGPACEATAPYQSLGSTGTASLMRKARMHETQSTRRPRGTSSARVPMVTTPVGTTRARSSFMGVWDRRMRGTVSIHGAGDAGRGMYIGRSRGSLGTRG